MEENKGNKYSKKVDPSDLSRQVVGNYFFPESKKDTRIIEKSEPNRKQDEKNLEEKQGGNSKLPDVPPKFDPINPTTCEGDTPHGEYSIKPIYHLLLIMLKHIDQTQGSKLKEILLNKDLDSSNKRPEFLCKKCGKIKLSFKRTCSHNSCFNCLQNNVKKYVNSPELSTFKNLRCQECFEVPKNLDLASLFKKHDDTLSKYKKAIVIKICFWCKQKLNLATDYLPELNCLHLCRECYSDQLYMKIKSCMVCKEKFINKNITLARMCTCTKCGNTGKLISKAFKCYFEDKIICFDCQLEIAKQNDWKSAFGSNEYTAVKGKFTHNFNKSCPYCNEVRCISEINICDNCANLKCDDCLSLEPKCKICEIR